MKKMTEEKAGNKSKIKEWNGPRETLRKQINIHTKYTAFLLHKRLSFPIHSDFSTCTRLLSLLLLLLTIFFIIIIQFKQLIWINAVFSAWKSN